MPLYFFSVRNGSGNLFDEDGVDLSDVGAAQEHARCLARELMFRNEARKRHWWVFVLDGAGEEFSPCRSSRSTIRSSISISRAQAINSTDVRKAIGAGGGGVRRQNGCSSGAGGDRPVEVAAFSCGLQRPNVVGR